jgi:O-succinylbenzoate synthase
MDSVDDLLAAIATAVEVGFKRVKLKFRPGWDLAMLRAVRREFPTQTFHIDCNSGYRLADLDLFRQVDEFGLAMIEQPLAYDDLVDHAKLQQAIRTPVCLDESITSLERVRQAIELGSCRYVNIKTGRVGGLTPAVQIHDACRDAGIPCWVGSMLESAVGTRINAALATLDNFTYPADLFATSRFYARDLGRPPVELLRGPDGSPRIAVSEEPGIGTEPDAEMLEKCCVARAALRGE